MRYLSLLLLAVAAPVAGAQSAPKYTKIVEVDSMALAGPSMSPNGRWIAFTATRDGRTQNVWIVSAAGGKPVQLTTGEYLDQQPQWFPNGHTIAFRSTRVGGCMIMGVDPAAGRVTDAPRRTTLETAFGCLPTPDGKSIVYSTNVLLPPTSAPGALKVVSINGGTPRVLDSSSAPGTGYIPGGFSLDGRFVNYDAVSTSRPEEIRRVAVSGGKPELVRRGTADMIFNGRPKELLFVGSDEVVRFHNPNTDTVRIESLSGQTLATVSLRGLRRAQFQQFRLASSGSLLIATDLNPQITHVMSTAGGAPKAVLPGEETWFSNFLSDGSVALDVLENDRPVLELVSPSGARRRLAMPDSEHLQTLTTDGRFAFWRNGDRAGVRDFTTGRSVALASPVVRMANLSPGVYSSDDEIPVVQRNGKALEYAAYSPRTNTTRVIAPAYEGNAYLATHGKVAAYSQVVGDSTFIYLKPEAGEARRIFAAHGMHSDGVAFSHDGRHLAFAVSILAGRDTSHTMGFVDLNPDGTPAGTVRVTPIHWADGVIWMPDNSGVLFLGLVGTDRRPAVMKLSPAPGAPPEILTQQEKGQMWEFNASPDGKWIGYPVDQPDRSAIWRVDLKRSPNLIR